jgi:hypothetical protein
MESFKKQIFTQLAIGLIVLAALIAGLVFFGSNIKDYSERISEGRQELFERSRALSSLASIRNQYETKAKTYLGLLYNIIPQRDQLINFSRDLRTAAGEVESFGFSFVSESSPTVDSLGVISFNVTIQTTISRLTEFIKNLEKFKFLVMIDSLSIERQRGDVFQAPFRGRVFFR